MFKNLLKIAIRNIFKDFGYSSLNILGLTLGITSALFLILYISDELSYDNYLEKADRIYRVSSHITETDDDFTWIVAQIPFAPQVKADYPELESYTRVFDYGRALFTYENKEFYEDELMYADSTIFDVFTYKFISGDPETALDAPNSIVLSKNLAVKYFGLEEPMGKSLVSGNRSLKVTGVIENVPFNSHLHFEGLVSRSTVANMRGSWGNFGVYTYLLLPEGLDGEEFETKIQEMYGKYMAEIFERMGIKIKYILTPIKRIHLYSNNPSEPEKTGNITFVYVFGIVAVFLLLIAAMNYMNLATARSSRRAREVGLRKVVGTHRSGLIFQFLTESLTLTLISVGLSLILFNLLLSQFNLIASKHFDVSILLSATNIYSLIGIILFIGVLGGAYPAFYLSRFEPAVVLKGEVNTKISRFSLRKVLVVIQFAISVFMIISTLVVFKQLNYLQNKDLGYDMEGVIGIGLNRQTIQKCDILKQKFLQHPEVKKVTFTDTEIGRGSGKVIFKVETDEGMKERGINFAVVDHDFVETMGITMLKGRDFSEEIPADTLTGVVINETLAKRFNWTEPLGKKVELGDENTIRGEVIGVMQDYHQTGMFDAIESLMLLYRKQGRIIYLKLDPQQEKQAIAKVESVWKEIFPEVPFSYRRLSDRFGEQFEEDKTKSLIFTMFTLLAIFIACLGLFGLASYTVEKRTKEIGVRKVMGSSEGLVVGLISKEFLVLIGIAMLIAFPLSWWAMSTWLENFVYRTQIGFMVYLLSALGTTLLTYITISLQAYKAAITNPTEALRVE